MAMRGQGWLYDKQIRNKIYQEKANKYNQEFEQLEDQGHEQDQVHQILSQKAYEKRHENAKDSLTPPYERSDKVLVLGGSTHLGFDKAHMSLSSTKTMMQPMEQRQQRTKEIIAKGGEPPELQMGRIQKQNEKMMKERIQFDHIKDLHQMKHTDPNLKKSSYQQNYVHNKYMQEECDNQNYDNHQMKNELKHYQEAYIKCRGTLRK